MGEAKLIVLLLAASLVWGSTFAMMKDLLSVFDTFALLAARFGMAAILFGAYVFARGKMPTSTDVRNGIFLGLVMFAIYATQTFGLNFTTATNSALITGLYVIFTPLLSVLYLKKMPGKNVAIAAMLSFAGLWFLTGAASSFNLGDAVTIVTALACAAQIILIAKYLPDSDGNWLILLQFATVALLSAALSTAFGTLPTAIPTFQTLFALAFLAVFASIFAFVILVEAQKRIEASKIAIILTTEPVFAALFGVLILQEVLGANQLIGGGLIIGAMLLAEWKK